MGKNCRSPHRRDSASSLAAMTISLLAGKWATEVILVLANGKQRFTALQRSLPGISHRVLTNELKRLQALQIILRTVYPTTPPSVEYGLTDSGVALDPVLHAAAEWAIRYLDKAPSRVGSRENTK